MSRLTPFGFLFGKSLTDLVRGIRKHTDPDQQAEYLRDVISECRDEVRSPDLDVKTTAILKLAYLEMLGYDMTWAGFHVTEVMASPHFQQKRIGYMAAMQSFRSDAELLMLVTNLVKMDLVNQNTATVGIALSGLATIVTPLLAADVADDIMRMLSHSKSYIRKKAVLALHNVVLQYPEVLPVALQRIADLLDDAQQDYTDAGNVSVVGATVSVICELATHAPSVQDFLELTPKLYTVFTTSQHNWTLIKLLKIFQLFTRREPRLKSRLLPVIRDMMDTTEAISLIYETMNCILLGGMLEADDFELANDIVKHVNGMIDKNDPNLLLISTGVLGSMAAINPQFVPNSIINELLGVSQPDPVTRKNIMALASKVVNDDTFYDLANVLMTQFRATSSREHKVDVAETISRMSAIQNYEFVPDFQWLISEIFSEICKEVKPIELGKRLLDIVIRVKDDSVRQSVSELCYTLVQQYVPGEYDGGVSYTDMEQNIDPNTGDEFLETCWWIIGEFPTPEMTSDFQQFIKTVVPSGTHAVSPTVVTSVVKLISKMPQRTESDLDAAIDLLTTYSYSVEYELQERSCQFLELLKLAKSSPEQADSLLYNGLSSLFEAYELTPIAPGSQLRVKSPAGLDLETPIDIPIATPSLLAQLDLDSGSESESDAISTRSSTPNAFSEDVFSDNKSEQEDAADKQLYNLSALDSMRSNPRKLVRPSKKKVIIAADETVGGESADEILTLQPASSKTPAVFRSGFRGPTREIIEPDSTIIDPPPVKVKHKKKKKKSKEHKEHKEEPKRPKESEEAESSKENQEAGEPETQKE